MFALFSLSPCEIVILLSMFVGAGLVVWILVVQPRLRGQQSGSGYPRNRPVDRLEDEVDDLRDTIRRQQADIDELQSRLRELTGKPPESGSTDITT